MGIETYERPREKIHTKGIHSLNRVELLQLVIGAGSAKISGARLARMVDAAIEKGGVSYETLTRVEGIGDAKACQLLAAFELEK